MNKNPKIKDYLAAGTPCLFLKTISPQDAEKSIKKAIKDLKLDCVFGVWKATTNLRIGSIDSTTDELKEVIDASDVISALNYIIKGNDSKKPLVIVLHHIRQFISDFQLIQQLIDSVMYARLVGSHIIFIGAELEFPPELQTLITVIDYPLPDREQIKIEYKKLIDGYKEEITLPENEKDLECLIDSATNSAVGLDTMCAENALALSFAISGTIDISIIQKQKEQEVKKSNVLEFIDVNETLNNVGGFGALKEWLRRRQKVFTPEAREFGLLFPKGILIAGIHGSGKSLCAKAVAAYLKLPLLRLDIGSVYSSLVGSSEERMRTALKIVDAVSPCVLWIDEVGRAMAGSRGSGNLDSGVSARVTSTLLTWRQETKSPVFLVATANEVEAIPPPLLRKGRIDEVWATDLPNASERKEIFLIHLTKRSRDPKKFNLNKLSELTVNFVGSEIESCIEDGMFYAFDQEEKLQNKHIIQAIDNTIPQAKRDAEEIKKIRKWVKERARNVSNTEKEQEEIKKCRTIRRSNQNMVLDDLKSNDILDKLLDITDDGEHCEN